MPREDAAIAPAERDDRGALRPLRSRRARAPVSPSSIARFLIRPSREVPGVIGLDDQFLALKASVCASKS
jgi:hypothetical protein